jgi:hypothetical protein
MRLITVVSSLNAQHTALQFTITEENNRISYLDLNVTERERSRYVQGVNSGTHNDSYHFMLSRWPRDDSDI